MSQTIYLVRHGEQQDAQHGLGDGPLSARGRRQAQLLAERIGGLPLTAAHHSPLQRASETARIMTEKMPALEPQPSALLMDCIPSGPEPDMPHSTLTLDTADGRCPVHAYHPDGDGPWPAAIVYMDGIGMRPAIMEIAEMTNHSATTVTANVTTVATADPVYE